MNAESPAGLPAAEAAFRFGRCEVDTVGREIRLDGQRSPIEPLPFDLLVHLIRQRHRVVTKRELLDELWPRETVTEGALARAVMKARQAIADDGLPPLIRTVPRVGYRFVAPLADDLPALAGRAGLPASADGPLSVAVLPFVNATADSALDWVPLGLMSLTLQTLNRHPCFAPVSTQALVTVAESRPQDDADALTVAVQAATGARCVVRGRVTGAPRGYRLSFDVMGVGWPLHGELRAEQPAQFAPQVAAALAQRLFPQAARVPTATHGHLHDPMAMEAFARALHAAASQKWTQATNLLRLALDLDPDAPDVQLELLRTLAAAGDAEGEALAQALLAHAEREGDLRYAACVYLALAQLHLNRDNLAAGSYHSEKALRVAAGQEAPDWTTQALLLQATIHARRLDCDAAHRSLDHVQQLCEGSGNRVLPLVALNTRAMVAAAQDQPERAVQLCAEAVRRARELQVQRCLAQAGAIATAQLVELARLDEAPAFGEEGFAAAIELGDWQLGAAIAASLACLYRLTSAPQALACITETLPRPAQLPCPADGWIVHGHHAVVAQRHDDAVRCFQQAVAWQREAGRLSQEHITAPWLVDALIRGGQYTQALAELQRLSQAPHDHNASLAAAMLHGRARLAHAGGDTPRALALTQQALAGRLTPLWRGLASIDAAWLLAEDGRSAPALALLAALPPALAAQPAAQAALARAQQQAEPVGHGEINVPSCLPSALQP